MVVASETLPTAAVLSSRIHFSFQCDASLKKCLTHKSDISALFKLPRIVAETPGIDQVLEIAEKETGKKKVIL